MAQLFGKQLTKKDLLSYTSNMRQIAGVTDSVYNSGKARDMRYFAVKNGSGLEFTLVDRCMDLASVSYKGVNISFLAKNGVVDTKYCYPFADEFLYYMTGGMLFTAGLRSAGTPCVDIDGTYHPLHGRIGTTPADNAYALEYWQDDDYILECGGVMHESRLFGNNLTLTRKVTTKFGENVIELSDTLENLAMEPEEFMLLYHFNFGYPFINENLKLIFPENKLTPRTEEAIKGVAEAEMLTKPQDGFLEHVFFRDVKDTDGIVSVRLENKELGIGVKLSYEKKNLPNLTQWKCMRSGDYVLGIEPCNCFIKGRKDERDNGTLKVINPLEKLEFKLWLEFYDVK